MLYEGFKTNIKKQQQQQQQLFNFKSLTVTELHEEIKIAQSYVIKKEYKFTDLNRIFATFSTPL